MSPLSKAAVFESNGFYAEYGSCMRKRFRCLKLDTLCAILEDLKCSDEMKHCSPSGMNRSAPVMSTTNLTHRGSATVACYLASELPS
jgi:hypothetical protein